jgi:hypothetical protein
MTRRPLSGRPRIAEVLLAETAPRERAVDDHMYEARHAGGLHPFRLQLFTAPGRRPVAVAIQTYDEGGSLTNRVEAYVEDVWRTHCPDEKRPPIWVQRFTDDGPGSEDAGAPEDTEEEDLEDTGFQMVTFHDGAPLRPAGWHPLSDADLERLVGRPVDRDRGTGYVPAPLPAPVERVEYWFVAVSELPEPRPFRERCMRPAESAHDRAVLAWRRVSGGRCCWYHRQDWTAASEQAIRIVEQARADGMSDDDIAAHRSELATACGVDTALRGAVYSLLQPATAITASLGPAGSYTNGQHRARAMKDAGVERTVVVAYQSAEAADGDDGLA